MAPSRCSCAFHHEELAAFEFGVSMHMTIGQQLCCVNIKEEQLPFHLFPCQTAETNDLLTHQLAPRPQVKKSVALLVSSVSCLSRF